MVKDVVYILVSSAPFAFNLRHYKTGQMLAALIATLLLTSAEVGCTRDGLREEMRMCAESWQLVLLSGVAHFLAIVSVNLALFHGTVTLVSIIKATELVFTASLSRVALGHKPSTKQAGAGLLLIVGLIALCVVDGGTNWRGHPPRANSFIPAHHVSRFHRRPFYLCPLLLTYHHSRTI